MAPKVAVIYYSLHGHCRTLAHHAFEAAKIDGAEVSIFQVPETLSEEVRAKMHAAPRSEDEVITPARLEEFDGFIFVIPTRYGRAVGQFSAFFDMTGGLWMKQALSRKMATVITSTGTQHGGQETTALTTMPFFAHHGIIYVPIGYKSPLVTDMSEIFAGGPFGSGTFAGPDGSRQPSAKELELVAFHGKYFTEVVAQYVKGA